jgi:hypothetical protein
MVFISLIALNILALMVPLIRTKENPYLTKTRSSFETSDPFLFFRTALDMKLDTVKQSQTQKFNDNGLLTGIWKGLL